MTTLDMTATSHADIAARIVAFLDEQSIAIDAAAPPSEIALLEGDALDSLGIVQLTMFLGDAYDVAIEDEDFVAENIATVDTLAAFVHAKLKA